MSDQTQGGIAWTDETWNPVRGCSRVSKGCEHCYAETVARRFSGPGQPYEGLVRLDAEGRAKAQWNGTVRFVEEHLGDPLRWTRPRKVFVNSMSDLFHEALPFETIAAIFGVMAAAPKHTFQVLTKRPKRAREFFAWLDEQGDELRDIIGEEPPSGTPLPTVCAMSVGDAMRPKVPSDIALGGDGWRAAMNAPWPLPNVWLGVSVEDQASADERIPELLACPAAVRWVSYEPALGPVDFDLPRCDVCGEAADGRTDDGAPWCSEHERECSYGHWLDFPSDGSFDVPAGQGANDGIVWIVVGGESGPGARPFDLAWARSVIAQGREAGTACFVKQLGSHLVADCMRCRGDGIDPMRVDGAGPEWCVECGGAAQSGIEPHRVRLDDRKGGDMAEWPPYMRVREWPRGAR